MHKKLLIGCGKAADSLSTGLGKNQGFILVVKKITAEVVYIFKGFASAFTVFLLNLFHVFKCYFSSVAATFLTSFHSPYYYELLSKISYINLEVV